MPLAPAVEAFARERGGVFGPCARWLAELLAAGVPLPDALDRCPGLLPRYALPMIRVGYETGTLAPALRRAARVRDLEEPIWMALQGKIAYLMLSPTIGVLLLTFIMLKIVPQFVKIFKDFGMQLPAMTQYLYQPRPVSPATTGFCCAPVFARPALLFYLPIRYFGWTDWDMPGMGRFTRRLDTAEILDALGAGRRSAPADCPRASPPCRTPIPRAASAGGWARRPRHRVGRRLGRVPPKQG